MDDKAKLYVFEKKEVFLIFLFMIIISITSFVLGVRIGKDYSFTAAGYTKEDQKVVKLYSAEEEKVQKVINDNSKMEKNLDLDAQVEQALKKKFEEEFSKDKKVVPQNSKKVDKEVKKEKMNEDAEVSEQPTMNTKIDSYKGKFTIQLGSRPSLEEAEEFAYTFKIRGYDPIINEATIEGRGTWYRVSIGVFPSVAEAKEYIQDESSLFQGQEDSFIVKFD